MKALLVIHGYPPRYNAGSENYTQNLAHGLKDEGIDVTVFSRDVDPFQPDYILSEEHDPLSPDIPVILVNHPRSNIRYRNASIDKAFRNVLEEVEPEVVHIGHLSHLSTGIVDEASEFGSRIVFTLHDYWLMCPRGQFLEWGLSSNEPWKLCNGQDDKKCAYNCFNRYTPRDENSKSDVYWHEWVKSRMEEVKRISSKVDLFISPSKHLLKRHVREFGIPEERITYIDYGFNHERFNGRKRVQEEDFVFGYIGRHHPSKGLDRLLKAFSGLNGRTKLKIWGKHDGQLTETLRRWSETNIPSGRVEWFNEYSNSSITKEVFNHCDCIVVPSIWDENSPLVIHEAQQARVPVITASYGGMGEYVVDGENGLTFRHRDINDLKSAMMRATDSKEKFRGLGERGYLYSRSGDVVSNNEHVKEIIQNYRLLKKTTFKNKEGVLCK